ncbi:hypothetical protein EPN52_14205 [bacterium]|nr:MAG: hypothetical protein EPN52_14205 [bacterium]
MRTMIAVLRAVLKDEAANALPEYAIIAAALALGMLATMATIGHEAGAQLGSTNQNLSNLAVSPR